MSTTKEGLVYLASVYSQGNATVNKRTRRFKHVCRKAAELMEQGYNVFCPIAHSHPIEVHGMTEVHGHDFWLKQDFAVLEKCSKLLVYCMPGWDKSVGIQREIEFADLMGIPVEFLEDV
jgi:hypothetical protein